MGVYLFREVNSAPIAADAPTHAERQAPEGPKADEAHADQDKPAVPDSGSAQRVAVRAPRVTKDTAVPVGDPGGGDPVTEELNRPNPKLDAVMSEANKAYDRGDFEDARAIALKVLAKDAANVRMRRIVVSSSCIDGDGTEAQKQYLLLPAPDREQMKVRCARYGVTFTDK